MKASRIFHQKQVLVHQDGDRMAVFEFVVWDVGKSIRYPEGLKFRVWLSENGKTLFGLDNHFPKGPHLHLRGEETAYVYRGLKELRKDVEAMLKKEGFEL